MAKLKISKMALKATLDIWQGYLSQLEAGEIAQIKCCPVCVEVRRILPNADHKPCKLYCPFHGRVCCNSRVIHTRTPLYWKFVSARLFDKQKAIKYAKMIIEAIKEQLEVSS